MLNFRNVHAGVNSNKLNKGFHLEVVTPGRSEFAFQSQILLRKSGCGVFLSHRFGILFLREGMCQSRTNTQPVGNSEAASQTSLLWSITALSCHTDFRVLLTDDVLLSKVYGQWMLSYILKGSKTSFVEARSLPRSLRSRNFRQKRSDACRYHFQEEPGLKSKKFVSEDMATRNAALRFQTLQNRPHRGQVLP